MRKKIGIGVMAALVAGLGLSSIPATVYADDSTGQADETTTRKNDGIYSVKVDGKELIKGDAVSELNPIYYFSNTEPKQIVAMKSFSAGAGWTQLPLRNIAPNETSSGSTVVTGKTYKPDGGSPFYVIWAKAGDFFKNMKISYNGSEAKINLYDSDEIDSKDAPAVYRTYGTATIHTAVPKDQAKDFFDKIHIPDDLQITGIPDGWKANPAIVMLPQNNANTDEWTADIAYTNPVFPNNEYVVKITFVNDGTPQAQQPTPEQPVQVAVDTVQQAPQLVQTGIEQTPLIALSATAVAGTTAYAIRKKRGK